MSWKVIVPIVVGLYFLGALILYLLQQKIIFFPEETEQDFIYSFDVLFEEKFLVTSDGGRINLLHFKPPSPRGAIVYYHGNAGNLERWGEVAEPLARMGYEVLIMDYRGYGKSTGRRTEKTMLADAELVYMEALKDWNEERVIVYGRSLGCSFASYIAGKHNPSRVILEAPFHSIADMAKRRIPIYPTNWLLRFRFNNEKSLANCNGPVHFFHGNEDNIVPFDSGRKLYESISCTKSFLEIKKGGHNDLQSFDEYWEELKEILD